MLHQVQYFICVCVCVCARAAQDYPDVLVAGCIFQTTFSKPPACPLVTVSVNRVAGEGGSLDGVCVCEWS